MAVLGSLLRKRYSCSEQLPDGEGSPEHGYLRNRPAGSSLAWALADVRP